VVCGHVFDLWPMETGDTKRICKLANAYTVTGDRVYAHKAGMMLDRVADLYPTFDFKEEGVLYEKPAAAGYVSTWHDACEEVRELGWVRKRVDGTIERVLLHGEALRVDQVDLSGKTGVTELFCER
jgi:hypothetical protein